MFEKLMNRSEPTPPGPTLWETPKLTVDFMKEQIPFVQRLQREYGDYVHFYLGAIENWLISDPEAIHEILVTKADKFQKDIITHELSRLLGQGLLTAEGDLWRRHRKIAAPTLQKKQIASYAETMSAFTRRHMDAWQGGDIRELHHDMMNLTMEIVVKTLFNLDPGPELEVVGKSVDKSMHYFHLMTHTPWRFVPEALPMPARTEFQEAVKILDVIIYDLIEKRKGATEGNDLLVRLMMARDEDGEPLSPIQLRDEVITMFLAGHETTALTVSYTWLLLMKNPDIKKRLFEEVDSVLGSRLATDDDVKELPYLTAIIKESLRLFPPAWIIGRDAKEDVEIGPWKVKKGTQVLVSQMVMHSREDIWGDPEVFRPERWLEPDFEKSLPRYAYMPFGGGARVCIGNHFAMMEAILIMATMAQSIDLDLKMTQPLKVQPAVTMRPITPITVAVHRR
jgi:cytochrome P450